MGYKLNPFTGKLDVTDSPSGAFEAVEVSGDLTLGTGTPVTTVQAVTPTANRTISFPDQTGTVALVAGATGAIQYNESGAQTGTVDFAVDPDWNNASTTFTGLKLNVTDTASAAGSNLLDLQNNGVTQATTTSNGSYYASGVNAVIGIGNSAFAGTQLTSNGVVLTNARNLSFTGSYSGVVKWNDVGFGRDQTGVVAITDGSTGTGYLKQTPVTVANLPSASTVGAGTRGFVSDATATTFASVVAGSGSNNVPVYSDGTDWRIG